MTRRTSKKFPTPLCYIWEILNKYLTWIIIFEINVNKKSCPKWNTSSHEKLKFFTLYEQEAKNISIIISKLEILSFFLFFHLKKRHKSLFWLYGFNYKKLNQQKIKWVLTIIQTYNSFKKIHNIAILCNI